jgi:hypothetical protein
MSDAFDPIRRTIARALHPAHFFVAAPATLEWRHTEGMEIPWEIFRGQLLDGSQTRARRAFETWDVLWAAGDGGAAQLLLSLLFDVEVGQLHVTRSLHCYGWEGYHAGDNVYLSREVRKWVRELVGTIELASYPDTDALCAELQGYLVQALVGVSRLPLTSVEAPLPAFSLGQVAYFARLAPGQTATSPMRSYQDLLAQSLHDGLGRSEQARHLEFFLRSIAAEELDAAVDDYAERWRALGLGPDELPVLLRTVFDEVALSPYTGFVDNALRFVDHLVSRGHLTTAAQVDFLGYLLRHLGRHLTAYDLVTFHHRGANYPDALLLDAVLKAYLTLTEAHPGLFAPDGEDTKTARLRRRALRQGWLLRRSYEGLPVPDAPTSPGENARVLPPPHQRVPDEQIYNPARRTRCLFAGDPLTTHLGDHGRDLLRQSVGDLRYPDELRELGMALFLDRPLGIGKAPGEPDRTPLLSYEAFSRSVAERRLRSLNEVTRGIVEGADWDGFLRTLAELPVEGVGLGPAAQSSRPGAVSIEDARKVADDVRFLRTTRRSLEDLLLRFDFASLAGQVSLDCIAADRPLLLIRDTAVAAEEALLAVHDARGRRRLELQVDWQPGYERHSEGEYPVAGLRVLRAWERTGVEGELREVDVRDRELRVLPRRPPDGSRFEPR